MYFVAKVAWTPQSKAHTLMHSYTFFLVENVYIASHKHQMNCYSIISYNPQILFLLENNLR